MTICQITRNDAEKRILAVLEGKKDPGLKGGLVLPKPSLQPGDLIEAFVDLEEQAFDQIRASIRVMNLQGLWRLSLTLRGMLRTAHLRVRTAGLTLLRGSARWDLSSHAFVSR